MAREIRSRRPAQQKRAERHHDAGGENSDPAGADISNIFDYDRQSRVIQLSGSGESNGFWLRNADGLAWNSTSRFVEWSINTLEPFTVYIELETDHGLRYLYYRPDNTDYLGDTHYVHYGLGSNAADGQWHTFVRDLHANLQNAQPDVNILKVNGFLQAEVGVHIIYDDDIRFDQITADNGTIIDEGEPRIQLRQFLAVGLSYDF